MSLLSFAQFWKIFQTARVVKRNLEILATSQLSQMVLISAKYQILPNEAGFGRINRISKNSNDFVSNSYYFSSELNAQQYNNMVRNCIIIIIIIRDF